MSRVISSNRKAYHDFDLVSDLEVGVMLLGWEVKAAKNGQVNLKGAFVKYSDRGELWLKQAQITQWKFAPPVSKEQEFRDRKLLAKRSEAARIGGLAQRPGYTLVPIELYINEKGLLKLKIAVVKGKKKFGKKQQLKEKDMKRQIQMEMKEAGLR